MRSIISYDDNKSMLQLFPRKLHHNKYLLSCIVKPITVELAYFLALSVLGFLALKLCEPRSAVFDLDLFFTSVSAATVSSMSTVEMEVFSNSQLIIITLLMLLGGEVFVSMLDLHIRYYYYQFRPNHQMEQEVIELGGISKLGEVNENDQISYIVDQSENKRESCGRSLSMVVLGYLVVVHMVGMLAVRTYLAVVPTARQILEGKSISLQTFTVMLVVSTFTNCGFAPTNENMVIFVRHSGLLLFVSPLILLGNTLYPVALRLFLHSLDKLTSRVDFRHILDDHHSELGYSHLLPPLRTRMLAATALGFLFIQLLLFSTMEWSSGALADLNPYQKLVASFFQVINSRHAGESVVDLSTISTAVLVVFVIMMYLPPYTTWFPWNTKDVSNYNENKITTLGMMISSILRLPQLGYLAIFIILVCITERHKLRDDPLNFNLLTIVVEVVSAYGNVGFSTCYSCKRRVKEVQISGCRDNWAGFVGRWSTDAKLILILVMLFGRLKKYTTSKPTSKAWVYE